MRPVPITPGPGQESVWDYPRPPRLEQVQRQIAMWFNGQQIVDCAECWRVLETSHPPVYYLPPAAIAPDVLRPAAGSSWCEWKGQAVYFDVVVGTAVAPRAAWSYPDPSAAFAALAGCVAFYAAPFERVLVDGVAVQPQPGSFYGGWITPEIVGPFKGAPGTSHW